MSTHDQTSTSSEVTTLPQVKPPGFKAHVHEHVVEVNHPWTVAWGWLHDPDTFIKGQPWPYRVEFLDTPQPDGTIARGFDVGTRNAHHGPFMNFCGVISRVSVEADRAERDLDYDYGAYALAFRLIRPTLLRISVDGLGPDRCRVTVRVESYVRGWIAGPWTLAQRCFWPFFSVALRWSCRRRVSTGTSSRR